MYDHIGLKVQDLDASVRFYTGALGALGHELARATTPARASARAARRRCGSMRRPAKQAAGTHVAFRATSRAQVDRFHAEGLKAGGRDNGRPGLRADYSPNYYAAFLIDPDGNNVEAVWME